MSPFMSSSLKIAVSDIYTKRRLNNTRLEDQISASDRIRSALRFYKMKKDPVKSLRDAGLIVFIFETKVKDSL